MTEEKMPDIQDEDFAAEAHHQSRVAGQSPPEAPVGCVVGF
jgi:hypothetical protein